MIVLKFGGTSVGNAQAIEELGSIVSNTLQNAGTAAVVISAMGGLTDQLLLAAKQAAEGIHQFPETVQTIKQRHLNTLETLFDQQVPPTVTKYIDQQLDDLQNLLQGIYLLREVSPRSLDCIAAFGEIMSSYMIAAYLDSRLGGVLHLDSRQIIKTDSNFTAAHVHFEETNTLLKNAYNTTDYQIFVQGGFIASNAKGVTTTLGRGGSDYTAAIVAAALDAEVLEIWTDVNGVLTADPRKVKKAFSLDKMTYEEAAEMSHFGAKVIHPPTILPAMQKNIPIKVRNTFNPAFSGTTIMRTVNDSHTVKGISSISAISLINIQGAGMKGVSGFASRTFKALAQKNINIILISQASSENSICFAIKPEDAENAIESLENEFEYEQKSRLIQQISVEHELTVVALVGSNMKHSTGVSGNMFMALGKNGINVHAIAQGSSELNISVVIHKNDETKALNALHEAFFLSDTRQLNLYMVGTGLIAKTLVAQINKQAQTLKQKHALEIHIAGITNSREMYLDPDGLLLSSIEDLSQTPSQEANLANFVDAMLESNLPNSIFVDCTASKDVILHYTRILAASISIVTPNKIANSGTYNDYVRLKSLARKHSVKLLYETNVGAGLPIISTLQNMLDSGDEIIKIEAVLSGSLSYIFNNFTEKKSFYEALSEAMQKGFTEPDPREDLSGMDVARKSLILAREMGLHAEMYDVKIEHFLPESCETTESIDAFLAAVQQESNYFEQIIQKAKQNGCVLRFIAKISPKGINIGLRNVPPDSPFYQLTGSDNMIVFTTARYNQPPLVIKGPGAGAEVTAAGVFAEIISLAHFL
ncbi:MAG: bifunctional aspartate kinase/homoserine dehydrogenase I [Chitinophagales bacterium]|nr:bifunctional aspartate kinase/homoserine dehydrogenase I [Bacteroidota bacterium]MCB9043171.1 bifunctional aspartate kinase/homoserine dehydrogenase I [Chitinophagales bacterium]